GSDSHARDILHRRNLLRLPGTRQGLEALCQKALLATSRVTWEQIQARCPDQWVVLTAHNWATAVVISCGTSRTGALEAVPPTIKRYGGFECRYTGRDPEPAGAQASNSPPPASASPAGASPQGLLENESSTPNSPPSKNTSGSHENP